MNGDKKWSADDVIVKYGENELFLLADELVNIFTEIFITIFFVLLHRNMKRVRENVKVIQKDGRGRSLSVVTRSEYRASADLGVMEINDT